MATIMARIRTVFLGVAGTPWYSNQYVDYSEETVQDDVNSVGEFWDALASAIASGVSWTVQGEVAHIDDSTGQTTGVTSVSSVTGAGTDTHDPLPWATQGLIRLRTGVYIGGRELRGRIYVPGLTEQNSGAGVPQTAMVEAMTNAASSSLLGPTGLNGSLRVFSKKNLKSNYVVTAQAWNQWASLRSRRD